MLDSNSPPDAGARQVVPGLVRAHSRITAAFAVTDGTTRVHRLFEQGSLRLRFPRGPRCEAVMLNTGGGITGGDRAEITLSLEHGAAVTVTSQAAEKLYRSDGPSAVIEVRAHLCDAARLCWLPQEAILFDGADVVRSLDVEMRASASLTLVEAVVFGRGAHGETLHAASWQDRWRIRRDGRLILAEYTCIDGAISQRLMRPGIGDGARAVATLVHVAPDAHTRLEPARSALAAASSMAACSAWNGMLVARFAARQMHRLRADLAALAEAVTGEAMPRAWTC